MGINWLIAYGFTILLMAIYLDKPLEAIGMIEEIMKILISGYLGYLVRSLED